jgi:hypothetical protein
VVDAHLLRAADQQVAVGENFGDDRGDREVQLLGAIDRTGPLELVEPSALKLPEASAAFLEMPKPSNPSAAAKEPLVLPWRERPLWLSNCA